MSDLVHTTLKEHGFIAKISYDQWAESPDCWEDENFAFMGEIKGNHKLGRKGWDISTAQFHIPWGEGPWSMDTYAEYWSNEDFESEDDLRKNYDRVHEDDYDIFPVEIADFGSNGLGLRWSDHEDADAYIFVKRPWTNELERLAHPNHDPDSIAKSIFDCWAKFLEGDVHEFVISDSDGHAIDRDEWDMSSCCGVFGYREAERLAKEAMQWLSSKTKKVKVLVTRRSQLSALTSEIVELEVPLSMGDRAVMAHANEVFNDAVQIDFYRGKEAA